MLAGVANVVAQSPAHVFVICGVNDFFNHGGAPIPPATSASNYTSYFNTIKASFPNVRFHVISNMWAGGENWPDGVNTNDAAVQNTNAAIKTATLAQPSAEWLDIRTPLFGINEPLQNPGHAANGILTQGDGTHPSKTAGQMAISKRVWELITLGV